MIINKSPQLLSKKPKYNVKRNDNKMFHYNYIDKLHEYYFQIDYTK